MKHIALILVTLWLGKPRLHLEPYLYRQKLFLLYLKHIQEIEAYRPTD